MYFNTVFICVICPVLACAFALPGPDTSKADSHRLLIPRIAPATAPDDRQVFRQALLTRHPNIESRGDFIHGPYFPINLPGNAVHLWNSKIFPEPPPFINDPQPSSPPYVFLSSFLGDCRAMQPPADINSPGDLAENFDCSKITGTVLFELQFTEPPILNTKIKTQTLWWVGRVLDGQLFLDGNKFGPVPEQRPKRGYRTDHSTYDIQQDIHILNQVNPLAMLQDNDSFVKVTRDFTTEFTRGLNYAFKDWSDQMSLKVLDPKHKDILLQVYPPWTKVWKRLLASG
ncbi:MAG: hypothetical protein M1829_004786 [Trizodia sp. TS-e1964]|nr:MAG: hypothetical protein M1829_004786 [Trizodia sp. TS-e1964]